MRHSREGIYETASVRSSRYEPKYPDVRYDYERRDYDTSARNSRVLVGSNADSGLGESTPQDFSSCCSSSADSTRAPRMVGSSFGFFI